MKMCVLMSVRSMVLSLNAALLRKASQRVGIWRKGNTESPERDYNVPPRISPFY